MPSFTVSAQSHNHADSQRLCAAMGNGWHLATPTNKATNDRLLHLLLQSGQGFLWLGVDDQQTEGVFRQHDGSVATYTHWAWGNPDNGNGPAGEDCVEMWTTGEWNDANCGQKRLFACEDPQGEEDGDGIQDPQDASSLPKPLTLSNGVQMPRVLLGAGGSTWMNDDKTDLMVYRALMAGFPGLDTANHYRNHEGVRRGIAGAKAHGWHGSVWLQTKIEGCGNSVDARSPILKGSCYEDTLAVIDKDLRALDVTRVDAILIHAPPCVPGASWNEGCVGPDPQDKVYPHLTDCSAKVPCGMIQSQWRALENAYKVGKARAIGVSNFCSACLQCIEEVATISPHINQVQLHPGMGSDDPAGLVSFSKSSGLEVQAYRPLAQGRVLSDPTVKAIAQTHGKTTAQVALRWIMQLGLTAITTTENEQHMHESLDLEAWSLTNHEMEALSRMPPPHGWVDNVVGELCRL